MSYEYQNFASLGVNLNRQKYGALDISQVFTSQADLDYYTSKGAITTGVSTYWYKSATDKVVPYPYAGQYVALVNNTSRVVTAYILQEKEDGTFETKEVGKLPTGDGKTIEVSADGQISLKADAPTDTETYNLAYKNGTLTWVKVDNTTLAGLESSIAALDSAVEALQTTAEGHTTDIAANKSATETNASAISGLDTRVSAAEGSITTINGSISTINSELANRYTKSETDSKISDAISSTTHLTFEVVEEVSASTITSPNKIYLYKDSAATASSSKDVYEEYMLIDGVITKIGSTETDLSGYATNDQLTAAQNTLQGSIDSLNADVTADKAALETFKGTVADTYETKEAASASHTELTNKIDTKANSDDLTALTGRVTTAEGDIDSLESKVESIVATGGEPNYIKSVDTEYFDVPTEGESKGKLSLTNKIPNKLSSLDSEIAGISSSLDTKLTATDLGSKITEQRNSVSGLFSDDQEAKLEGVAEGAEVNKIDVIKVGTTALDISDKTVTIPYGTTGNYGVVTTSTAVNKVAVEMDGTMTINEVSITKLYQEDEDVLVFDCGQA